MSYAVYLVIYAGMPRDQNAIFVEENEDESRRLYHVEGDIQNGMHYRVETAMKPENSASFQNKTRIGTITAANESRIKEICGNIPPPKKQFQGGKRWYPAEPLRRCQEWTAGAIQSPAGRTSSSVVTVSRSACDPNA